MDMARFFFPGGRTPQITHGRIERQSTPCAMLLSRIRPLAPPDAPTKLPRGVYTAYHDGHLFCFAVKSNGQGYGMYLPEGLPEHELLARFYLRLEEDDAPQLKLVS
jgi:hypothetical protein